MDGDLASLKRAHNQGIDMNLSDNDQRTALHRACAEKPIHRIKLLVNIGFNLDIQDRWAVRASHESV